MCEMRKILHQDVANLRFLTDGFKPEFESMYPIDERTKEHF